MASCDDIVIEEACKSLHELGWAVIPSVLSEKECTDSISKIKQWLSQFGEESPTSIRSLLHQYNVAHLTPAWEARLKVKPVFAKIWNTEKLHTSTDGIAIGKPPELGENKFDDEAPGAGTLHHDQEAERLGLHAYQGALYLEEALEDDWTFMVIEKSHNFHQEFFATHKKEPGNWWKKISKNEIQWYENDCGCTLKRLVIPKGSLVLWDSRTVHAGAPPLRDRANPMRWRYVFFISMTPAIWASSDDIELKQEAYRTLRISKHWSSDGFGMFPPSNEHPCNVTQLPDVAKTTEARLLAGDMKYDFKDGTSNGPTWKPKWSVKN